MLIKFEHRGRAGDVGVIVRTVDGCEHPIRGDYVDIVERITAAAAGER